MDEPNYDTRSRWHNIVPGMRQVIHVLLLSCSRRVDLAQIVGKFIAMSTYKHTCIQYIS